METKNITHLDQRNQIKQKELDLTLENVGEKTEKLKKLRDKNVSF